MAERDVVQAGPTTAFADIGIYADDIPMAYSEVKP
jgi:hypothetical protein